MFGGHLPKGFWMALFRAAFLLACFGALRISELVAQSKSDSSMPHIHVMCVWTGEWERALTIIKYLAYMKLQHLGGGSLFRYGPWTDHIFALESLFPLPTPALQGAASVGQLHYCLNGVFISHCSLHTLVPAFSSLFVFYTYGQ